MMKAQVGDVIECPGCKQPVGKIVKAIPDDSKVLEEQFAMMTKTYRGEGPLCDVCNGVAAFHDDQNIGWTIQIRGLRVS